MLKQIVEWLKKSPRERPADLIAFEEAQTRLRNTTKRIDERADKITRMIESMQGRRPATVRAQKKRAHR